MSIRVPERNASKAGKHPPPPPLFYIGTKELNIWERKQRHKIENDAGVRRNRFTTKAFLYNLFRPIYLSWCYALQASQVQELKLKNPQSNTTQDTLRKLWSD